MKNPQSPQLPPLFGASALNAAGDVPKQRASWKALAIQTAYGEWPLPKDAPSRTYLGEHDLPLNSGLRVTSRLAFSCMKQVSFIIDAFLPAKAKGRLPVVIYGDGCWNYLTGSILKAILETGVALIRFNRLELFADARTQPHWHGLSAQFPNHPAGAVAAWAWGISRVVDAVCADSKYDPSRIAVVGHSRGGKASLLAGALDERIGFVSANQSGCLGAGCLRRCGENAETLSDILRAFPYWFHPGLATWIGRETECPFDQHMLKALVAPRCLLCTESEDDHWANPFGARLTHEAALEAWRIQGADPQRAQLHLRKGPHAHSEEDWLCFLNWFVSRAAL